MTHTSVDTGTAANRAGSHRGMERPQRPSRNTRHWLFGTYLSSAAFAAGTALFLLLPPRSCWTTPSDAGAPVISTDIPQGQHVFDNVILAPGGSGERCVTVHTTTPLSALRISPDAENSTGTLSDHTQLTVTLGHGGGYPRCDGFTPLPTDSTVFDGTMTDFDNDPTTQGYGAWTTPRAGSVTYRIAYRTDLDPGTGSASFALDWSATSTGSPNGC